MPWQITIHFTFFFLSRMYACFSVLLKQIHTVPYQLIIVVFFFRQKILRGVHHTGLWLRTGCVTNAQVSFFGRTGF